MLARIKLYVHYIIIHFCANLISHVIKEMRKKSYTVILYVIHLTKRINSFTQIIVPTKKQNLLENDLPRFVL